MTKKYLRELVKEVAQELLEASTTGGSATFTPGDGMNYATPHAFSKSTKDNRAVKLLKKLGYTKVERPKRPSHTKMFDYLENKL